MKTCTKCKVEKELVDFGKHKLSKGGYHLRCKSCRNEYYLNNKEILKVKRREYIKRNKEKLKYKTKKYYEANKKKIRESHKKYQEANKEKIKEKAKQYAEANKEKIKEDVRKYQKQRRNQDSLFRMSGNLRSRTKEAFKRKGYKKTSQTQELLGVDWEVCKAHIERQFTKGMNWSNYGQWHIDHYIPLASAKNEKELIKLCYYRNLQPLWATDNRSKSDKIIGQQSFMRL
tara:strand:- start:38 stop:727 length:690 start_codon:yes stop_codon:yes gene_type:complete